MVGPLGRERSLITQRPFRSPHHTVSDAGLIGGGSIPLPGEISIHIEVPRLKHEELLGTGQGEPSKAIRERVQAARAVQARRFEGSGIFVNAAMESRQVRAYCKVDPDAEVLLQAAIQRLGLSARAYDRVLKLSRTIADLAGTETIGVPHVAEAIQYRSLDRQG